VDEKTRHVTSTNAGHAPALIAGGTRRRLDAGGLPAGMFSHVAYAQETTFLPAGARVILFTDGIAERLTPKLECDIVRASPYLSAHDMCSSVFHTADESGILPVAGWDDDSTVLVVAAD
jgi:serine phosphatase RsbU (regulator of sigma subunit)